MVKSFVVENPQALTDQLLALRDSVGESTLRQAAVAGARVFFDEVKLRVPVRSGLGEESLLIAYDREVSVEARIASYIVTWSKKAFYLRFVEYGTSKMAAKPFLRPAYEAKKSEAARAVTAVFEAKASEVSNVK